MSEPIKESVKISHKDLFDVWHQGKAKTKVQDVVHYVLNLIKDELDSSNLNRIRETIRLLCKRVETKWQESNRTKEKFLKKNESWINGFLEVHYDKKCPVSLCKKTGRPSLDYNVLSKRSKIRRAGAVAQQFGDPSLLIHAAKICTTRNKQSSNLRTPLEDVTNTGQSGMQKRNTFLSPPVIPLTPEEGLGFLLNNNFTKQQYINIRLACKTHNADIYPTYDKILEAKTACRVPGLQVDDTTAHVPLQNLLDKTLSRIVELQKVVLEEFMSNKKIVSCEVEGRLMCSYGFDGSSGQARYKQALSSKDESCSDSSIFATTLIPLRLEVNNTILWNNCTPQSIRFCRPLKLQYVKESKEHVLKEKASLDSEISQLAPLTFQISDTKKITIKYVLFMTLIDGKILNIITGNKSSQSCPVCHATPTIFKNVRYFDSEKYQPKPNTLQYGISPLHCWIRFFECILHIAYRSNFKSWQVRGAELKTLFNARKAEIQKRFWDQMHLHVDKPKDSGFGTTNDGNTSRRAFEQPDLFASITEVNVDLIKRFRIILIALSCQYSLNSQLFGDYCRATGKLYIDLYDWYPMPASIHKVLIHGKQILENSVLPLGFLSEDASESRNKIYERDREFHARKDSRKHNLFDIFNRAIDTSDPIISTMSLKQRMHKRQHLSLPSEVLNLLTCDEPNQNAENLELEHEDGSAENNYYPPEWLNLELENQEEVESL